ncbi:MAG: methylenetetrahydrofolate reductase C-terminal domain-containing protein, partial [Candidatus Omnitrophica bacterium]|nr:methylenetetrahydrofolate reductase C-terminal domain-containing protein [Candidatus Omnitrophota bacterium]
MEQATAVDYTKFRLKPDEEIKEVLAQNPDISVIFCNKCYKEFETDNEPECNKLAELVKSEQVKISKCVSVDFLCNKHHTQEKLASLDTNGAQVVGVVSCGIGIQVVADILAEKKKRVVSLADSIPQSNNAAAITSYHGIALGPEKCAGCAQCYLNLTGGLCPVVDCAKSLLNGACGGTNNGKCEINPDKDCVWEQIYQRLKKQGRSLSSSVEVRDYNRFNIEEQIGAIKSVQEKRDMSFYGGLYPEENKEQTQNLKIEEFNEPQEIAVFLSQHIGSPSECLVKVGDKVKVGQKIGQSTGFVSTTVHAGVSGQVTAIEERMHPAWLIPLTAVIIENDKTALVDESVKAVSDWENTSNEKLLEILQDKGLVGLGGAMFPTHVKLAPPKEKKIDTLLINGCECEPYLNGDNRLMIEKPEDLIKGINIAEKILGVEKVFIGIEENKPEAIEIMQK